MYVHNLVSTEKCPIEGKEKKLSRLFFFLFFFGAERKAERESETLHLLRLGRGRGGTCGQVGEFDKSRRKEDETGKRIRKRGRASSCLECHLPSSFSFSLSLSVGAELLASLGKSSP